MCHAGRFAFLEFRTKELADNAVQLDKLELCGRPMNVGRPKGYVVRTLLAACRRTLSLKTCQQEQPGQSKEPASPDKDAHT